MSQKVVCPLARYTCKHKVEFGSVLSQNRCRRYQLRARAKARHPLDTHSVPEDRLHAHGAAQKPERALSRLEVMRTGFLWARDFSARARSVLGSQRPPADTEQVKKGAATPAEAALCLIVLYLKPEVSI